MRAHNTLRPKVLSAKLLRAFGAVWRGLREWCGDAAYERYLRSCEAKRGASPVLTRSEFYVAQLECRYSRPNRCC